MGWKDRAQPVTGNWRDRAESAEAAPQPAPEESFWQKAKRVFSDPKLLEKEVRRQEKQEPEIWGALAAGAHGPAMAMEGPVAGASAVLDKLHAADYSGLGDAYRGARDKVEAEQRQNLKEHPIAPVVGSVITNPGSAPTVLGRLAMGAGQGALYGLGSSSADLTKGEFEKGGMDALKGGGVGLAAAGLGELAQLPGRAMLGRAGKIADATKAAELAAETEARAGAVASAAGKEGGLTAGGKRIWAELSDAMFNPAATEEQKAAARAFINSPEGKALYQQVLGNYIEEAPGQMGRILGAREAKAAAQAANKPELIDQAAQAAANAKLLDPSGVTGRLGELARRNLPSVIGGAMAGPAGATAGGVVAGALGKPGTIMSNMLKSPSMYLPLVSGGAVGTGAGEAMTRAAIPLAPWSRFLAPDDEESTP